MEHFMAQPDSSATGGTIMISTKKDDTVYIGIGSQNIEDGEIIPKEKTYSLMAKGPGQVISASTAIESNLEASFIEGKAEPTKLMTDVLWIMDEAELDQPQRLTCPGTPASTLDPDAAEFHPYTPLHGGEETGKRRTRGSGKQDADLAQKKTEALARPIEEIDRKSSSEARRTLTSAQYEARTNRMSQRDWQAKVGPETIMVNRRIQDKLKADRAARFGIPKDVVRRPRRDDVVITVPPPPMHQDNVPFQQWRMDKWSTALMNDNSNFVGQQRHGRYAQRPRFMSVKITTGPKDFISQTIAR